MADLLPASENSVAVHSLDHFRLAVPDLDEAVRFYEAFGLDVRRDGDTAELRTAGSSHVWARLSPGERKRLTGLTFGIFPEDAGRFAEQLGVARSDGGLCTATPDGVPVELIVAPKVTPTAKSSFVVASPGDPARGAGARSRVAKVRPRRLAHLSMYTADVQRSIDFFHDRLGLRVSDRSADIVAFMHSPHGSDHHLVALASSTGAGMHHCSWDVASLEEVGQGAAQMAAAGFPDGWGLGRHVLGSNYFHYVRDPWGSYSEYSADMDYIPAGAAWQEGDHPVDDSFYQWGPVPPEDFVRNYETAAA